MDLDLEKQKELEEQKKRFEEQLVLFKRAVNRMEYSEKEYKKKNSIINYDIETIGTWLKNPVKYQNQLRQLSQYFYNVSSLYRQIIRYMALKPTYAYSIVPYSVPDKIDKEKFKKQYMKTLHYVDKLNLSHEMIKAMIIAFREDTFYGYEHETKDSYFIQPLDARYCRISSIEDSVFNFSYDFSYFDTYPEYLEIFPEEFRDKYNTYKATKEKWIELDSNNTICLKVNTDFLYSLPPFSTMFQSIVDLDEYKAIKKARAKNDNFMALIQKIPMDDKNPELNKFLIDLDLAMTFHQMASDTVPEGVGVITSPMDIEAVKTEKGRSDNDHVNEAYREAFRDAGISEFLFNSDKNTSIGLSKSILTDDEVVFSMLRQIESWLNRKLKRMSGAYKFKVNMLNVTVFNQEGKQKEYLELAQYGIPVKLEIGAVAGLSPLDFINKTILENDILGLQDSLIPLKSTHTQSKSDGEVGRPKKNEDELSDSGQINIDKDTDAKKQE